MRSLLPFLFLFPLCSLAFDPSTYIRQSATCKALKRDTDTTVNIQLSYIDINPTAQTTLLFVHGWPSIWSTWARQIEEFEKDYRLIVPDLRGFGRSTHPDDVKTSGTLFDNVGDLVCILQNANIDHTICVGHDWGSSICYEAGRSRPDVFRGIVGGVVPYIPSAGDFLPIKALTRSFPKLTYQLFFDGKTHEAVKELDNDIRRSLRSTLRGRRSPPPSAFLTDPNSFLGAWSDYEEIPPIPFFSKEEEDYMVQEFSVQGYRNTLQFYTTENRKESWRHAHEQGNFTLPQHVLAIYPAHDTVADWVAVSKVLKSEVFLPRLTTEVIEGSHWIQLENSQAFNDAMRKWLELHFVQPRRISDEL